MRNIRSKVRAGVGVRVRVRVKVIRVRVRVRVKVIRVSSGNFSLYVLIYIASL